MDHEALTKAVSNGTRQFAALSPIFFNAPPASSESTNLTYLERFIVSSTTAEHKRGCVRGQYVNGLPTEVPIDAIKYTWDEFVEKQRELAPYLTPPEAIIHASRFLAEDPSPGQLRVREIASASETREVMCSRIKSDPTIQDDAITGHRASLTTGEKRYVAWQQDRSRIEHLLGEPVAIQGPLAVTRVEPGGHNHCPKLFEFLRPDKRSGEFLHAVFNEGTPAGVEEPWGLILVEDKIALCGGGASRTLAHVAGGVMISQHFGHWTLSDVPADNELSNTFSWLEEHNPELLASGLARSWSHWTVDEYFTRRQELIDAVNRLASRRQSRIYRLWPRPFLRSGKH